MSFYRTADRARDKDRTAEQVRCKPSHERRPSAAGSAEAPAALAVSD
jgi:hypothetical protein